jgi:ABC-type transport system involved in multi-copper enzyme maturation permease subunit
MYVWKLWRDTRVRVLVCLLLGGVWVGLIAYGAATRTAENGATPRAVQALWSEVTGWAVGVTALMAVLAALALGEVAVGEEFAKGTVEILLTRPRRRRSIIWTGYIFGLGELVLLMLLTTLCSFVLLSSMSGMVFSWRMLATCILLLPMVSIVYGLGVLSSVLTKSGHRGAATALLFVLLYIAVLTVLQFYTHVRRPDWWFDTLDEWLTHPQASFPVLGLLGWTLLSLLLPLLAQWNLERKEI